MFPCAILVLGVSGPPAIHLDVDGSLRMGWDGFTMDGSTYFVTSSSEESIGPAIWTLVGGKVKI